MLHFGSQCAFVQQHNISQSREGTLSLLMKENIRNYKKHCLNKPTSRSDVTCCRDVFQTQWE